MNQPKDYIDPELDELFQRRDELKQQLKANTDYGEIVRINGLLANIVSRINNILN